MQKPTNITKHEMIGLNVEIIKSTNKRNIGMKGTIIDETRNMLTLKTKYGEKKIIKKNSTFMFTLTNKKIMVDGTLLVGKPVSRIAKKIPKMRV